MVCKNRLIKKTVDTNYSVLLTCLHTLTIERNEIGAKASGFLKQLLKFDFILLCKC